jgi:hypothetical protein
MVGIKVLRAGRRGVTGTLCVAVEVRGTLRTAVRLLGEDVGVAAGVAVLVVSRAGR